MKGYTDFYAGFLGPQAVATKPIGAMKYMDWKKVQKVVDEHPNSIIYAGLMEDWNNTSGLIFAKGEYYDGYVFGASSWATPIVDVDGEEIECWTHEETEEGSGRPDWWGNGQELLNEYDFEEDDEDEDDDEGAVTNEQPEKHNEETETIYLTDITGTIGAWLDAEFDDEVPEEVIDLFHEAYKITVAKYEDANKTDKEKIYDELCAVLSRYEESDDDESDLLYDMLRKIQSRWEDVITAVD